MLHHRPNCKYAIDACTTFPSPVISDGYSHLAPGYLLISNGNMKSNCGQQRSSESFVIPCWMALYVASVPVWQQGQEITSESLQAIIVLCLGYFEISICESDQHVWTDGVRLMQNRYREWRNLWIAPHGIALTKVRRILRILAQATRK